MFASVAAVVLIASPAVAQSTFSLGTGFNFGNVQTGAATASTGSAAAGSLATGQVTNIGSGIAAVTPVGSLSAGVGASAGQAGSVSGAASIGTGAAITAGASRITGIGAGVGFTNVTP